jgi:hypothetical protein
LKRILWIVALAGCDGQIFAGAGPLSNLGPGGSGGTGGGEDPTALVFDPSFACAAPAQAVPTAVRRLSKRVVVAAVRELFSALDAASLEGLMASVQSQVDLLPDDSSTHGDTRVTQAHVDAMVELAFALGSRLEANAAWVQQLQHRPCGPTATPATLGDDACLYAFIGYYGKKAYRRVITADEMTELVTFYRAQPASALALLLGRLIASPRFYYPLDDEGRLVSGTEGQDATFALTADELAAKLTFLFWQAPPDDRLYALVEAGGDLEAMLGYVLGSARARESLAAFVGEWLFVRDVLPDLPSFDTAAFQAFAAGENVGDPGHDHKEAMREELVDLVSHYTLSEPGRYDDLLLSPRSFTRSADLAHLYGVAPWGGAGSAPVTFPEGERAGLLTRAALLASGSELTRPVIRGRTIRRRVLCDTLNDPPPNVKIPPLVQRPGQTMRQVVEEATAGVYCQTCHSQMNPLGFALEGYDALGRARAQEHLFDPNGALVATHPVDTKVTVRLFGAQQAQVEGGVGLSQLVAESGKGHQCYVRQYFRFAEGRDETLADGCHLEQMRQGLMGSAGSLRHMLEQHARSVQFRQRRPL